MSTSTSVKCVTNKSTIQQQDIAAHIARRELKGDRKELEKACQSPRSQFTLGKQTFY